MSPFTAFLIMGGLFAGARRFIQSRSNDRGWAKATSSLGLDWSGYTSLQGHVGGAPVTVELVQRDKGNLAVNYTRVRTRAPVAATLLTIRGEDAWSKVQKLVGSSDVLVGDDDFDQRVHIQGEPSQIVSLMNADVRRLLVAFVENHDGALEDGELLIEIQGIVDNPLSLEMAVGGLRSVLKALDVPPWEVEERLAHNATHDVLAQVRARNFSLLVERDARSELTLTTASMLLKDMDPSLRLAAARVLRDDASFEMLTQLVRSTARTQLREAALELLLEHWPYDRCSPSVVAALRTGRPSLRRIAVEAQLNNRDRSQLELLARCAGMDDELLAEAAIRALGALSDATHEQVFVEQLRHRSDGVKLSAIRSLGRVGTVAAVEPLLPLSTGLLTAGFLKEAARDAIRRIQGRAGPVDAGRLSLVANHEASGALSIAAEGGELAVAEPPDEAT